MLSNDTSDRTLRYQLETELQRIAAMVCGVPP